MNDLTFAEYIKDKKVTVMGLGLLGRGVNVVRYLARKGALLTVTDVKTATELEQSLALLSEYEDITYVLGEHRKEDFKNADLIIKGPGVPLDSPYITVAEMAGVPVKMDASLFAEYAPRGVVLIGVTGTKGKSTVSAMIHHILTSVLKRSFLAGNIKGQATLPLLDTVRSGDYVVLELDSWQLQGFAEAKISPSIAVFTNFFPDHLNYYKGSSSEPDSFRSGMEAYFNDKAAIYRNQGRNDWLVLSSNSFDALQKYEKGKPAGKIAVAKSVLLPHSWKLTTLGEHNRMNAAQGYQVARILGIEERDIRSALLSFQGVPGRLELVHEKDGVKYYNDTNASTPEATVASLSSFPDSEVVLITGGVSKDFLSESISELAQAINKHVFRVVLLPGGMTDKLERELTVFHVGVSSMQEAVKEACMGVRVGSIILMSPGAASFGLFKNEYDRGDQFVEEVKNL